MTIFLAISSTLLLATTVFFAYRSSIRRKSGKVEFKEKSIAMAMEAAKITAWEYDLGTNQYKIFYGNFASDKINKFDKTDTHVHPDDKEAYYAFIKELVEKKNFGTISVRLKSTENGDFRHCETSISVIRDNTGKPLRLAGVSKDVSETKRWENEFSKTRELTGSIFENLPIGIELYDADGRMKDINNTEMQWFGVADKNDVLGKSIFENPNITDAVKARLRELKNVEFHLDYSFEKAAETGYYQPHISGEKHFLARGIVVGADRGVAEGYVFMLLDLTDDYIKNQKFSDLARNLQLAVDAAGIGIWEYRIKERAFYKLYGEVYIKDGTTFEERLQQLDEDSRAEKRSILGKFESGEIDHANITICQPQDDGSRMYFECKMVLILDKNGCPLSVLSTHKNVTDVFNKERERQLLLSDIKSEHERLLLAMEVGNISAWTYYPDREIFVPLHGDVHSGEGISIKDNAKGMHPDDALRCETVLRNIVKGISEKGEDVFRFIDQSVDGGYRYFESRMVAMRDAAGKIVNVIGFRKDITRDILYKKYLEESKTKTELAVKSASMTQWDYDCPTKSFIDDNSWADNACVTICLLPTTSCRFTPTTGVRASRLSIK